MTSNFGGFAHTSPVSSLHHDPEVSLASNCVRGAFGPTVQTVFDAVQMRGGKSTLLQIIASIRKPCRRVVNEERERVIRNGGKKGAKYKLHRARGPVAKGYVVDVAPIRSALLVLVQHDVVKAHLNGKKPATYELNLARARLFTRYPRIIEYTKRALDETAATLIEALLLHGRQGTVDAVMATVTLLSEQNHGDIKSAKYTHRQAVVECFRRLVAGGFIEQVPFLRDESLQEDGENEFGEVPNAVRIRPELDMDDGAGAVEDPAVVQILSNMPYRTVLPRQAVWRVSFHMYHQSLRAFSLGRLVTERFGNKVQCAGSIVTAALKLAAHRKHALRMSDIETQDPFTPGDIIPFLPRTIQQILEKKPGGLARNLSKALVELSKMTFPSVVSELERSVGGANLGTFQVDVPALVRHLRNRVTNQMILDSFGEYAARICSILRSYGHLEASAIAEKAMIPVKDTQTLLHQLYRANYLSLFTLNPSKHHNPSNMIYLWSVTPSRLLRNVRGNACLALTNMRLRRQHEVEVGKEWIERAEEAGATDENENEADKAKYNMFCLGLERLDNAIIQLDDTLMAMYDF